MSSLHGIIKKDYHDRVRKGIAEIGRANPDIIRGYRMLGDAGRKTDLLGAKTRELIALAVAVTVQCDGCIVFIRRRRYKRRQRRGDSRGAECRRSRQALR